MKLCELWAMWAMPKTPVSHSVSQHFQHCPFIAYCVCVCLGAQSKTTLFPVYLAYSFTITRNLTATTKTAKLATKRIKGQNFKPMFSPPDIDRENITVSKRNTANPMECYEHRCLSLGGHCHFILAAFLAEEFLQHKLAADLHLTPKATAFKHLVWKRFKYTTIHAL